MKTSHVLIFLVFSVATSAGAVDTTVRDDQALPAYGEGEGSACRMVSSIQTFFDGPAPATADAAVKTAPARTDNSPE